MHTTEASLCSSWLYLALLLAGLIAIFLYKKFLAKRRLDAVRNRVPPQTNSELIYVALEIDNLLVCLSDRKRPGYSHV